MYASLIHQTAVCGVDSAGDQADRVPQPADEDHRRRFLIINVAAFGDGDDSDGNGLIVDCVDHAQIANPITVRAGEPLRALTLLPALGSVSSDWKHRVSFLATDLSDRS
jgi:hypothetical protein